MLYDFNNSVHEHEQIKFNFPYNSCLATSFAKVSFFPMQENTKIGNNTLIPSQLTHEFACLRP